MDREFMARMETNQAQMEILKTEYQKLELVSEAFYYHH